MQPLIAHQSVMLVVFLISIFIWRVLDTMIDVRSRIRLRAGAQRQDKGSLVVIFVLLIGGIFLGTVLAFLLPATTITSARIFFFWLGIFLINAGTALRLYAISVLGRFFTTTIAITPGQRVIDKGPYHLIRHPAYTGILITLLGYALCLTNWLSLIVIMGSALISLSYRIQVEEQVLQAQLGQQYREYMRHTKRLIPFVL